MSNPVNQSVYPIYAPIYDRLFGTVMKKTRQRSVDLLSLQPGDYLLIPGILGNKELGTVRKNAKTEGMKPGTLDWCYNYFANGCS